MFGKYTPTQKLHHNKNSNKKKRMKKEMKKKETPNTLRTAAIYIRVSTHGKQEELSPDSQKKLAIEYAKNHGYLVSNEYIFLDSGISGRKAEKRPEFKRMIALAKSAEHPFQAILVWKFSRFARNQEESIVYKSMLQKEHVEVISISEPIIDGPFGGLIERIIEWMDEYYSIRLSGDVTRGMMEKAERGGYLAIPPYGYDRQKGQSIPTINETQAATVRHIYHMYLEEGLGTVDIARKLNHAGIHTRTGSLWECRSVEYILKNPFYIGKVRWNRQDHETHSIRDESEWIIRDALHTPIIPEETFYAVQTRMKETFSPARRRCVSASRHWLAGILYCSCCQKRLAYSPGHDKRTGKNHPYFQCYQYGKGLCEESHAISIPKAEEAFINGLEEFIQSDGYSYEVKNSTEQGNQELSRLSDTLSSISKKEARIKAAYLDGIDTLEEYKENRKKIGEEKEVILKKIKELTPDPENEPDYRSISIQKAEELITNLKASDKTEEQKAIMVRSVIEKVIYDKKNHHMEFHVYVVRLP